MRSFVVGVALAGLLAVGLAQAAPVQLVLNAPDTSTAYGQQADANAGPPLPVTFNVGAGVTLTQFVWWGYDDPSGAPDDLFAITLNGSTVGDQASAVGTFSREDTGLNVSDGSVEADLIKYTLDFDGGVLSAAGVNTIELVNNGLGATWFWQGVVDDDQFANPAWALYGERAQQVPEPASLALVLGALLTAGAAARRRG